MTATAALGWVVACGLGVYAARLRRRLELVARAEHELRGPLTAFTLALDSARGTPVGRRLAVLLEAELARARAGLADLTAARSGRRAESTPSDVRVDRLVRSSAAAWERAGRGRVRVRFEAGAAVVHGDGGRLAQAVGNVLANAVEHGDGDVAVRGVRAGDRVRVEVTNAVRAGRAGPVARRGRGRGLAIASDAAADLGGTLTTGAGSRRAVSILDLPVEP